MKIAWRELIRRPGRFGSVAGALTLLVVLLVVLGGFLDGLELSQTGSYRALGEVVLAFDDDAELLRPRSRLDTEVAQQIAAVDGVDSVGGVASLATTATVPDRDEPIDVVTFGYEQASGRLPEPPPAGEVVVDSSAADVYGVAVGDTLRVGPDETPLTVSALVDDAPEGTPTLWLAADAWRQLAATAQPVNALPPGVFEILVVTPTTGTDVQDVTDRVDAATGTTQTVTVEDAIAALPVVAQQSSTFAGIIGVTFIVSLLVVALFFALITLERRKLYAVLKALGGGSASLLGGVALQSMAVAVFALVSGIGLAVGLIALLPAELPLRIVPFRLAIIAGGTVVTAVIGALFTLRRILRIDPAEAIG